MDSMGEAKMEDYQDLIAPAVDDFVLNTILYVSMKHKNLAHPLIRLQLRIGSIRTAPQALTFFSC
jgi:hypothetical protein